MNAPRSTIDSLGYQVPVAGFSQAVKAPLRGTVIFISGLTARDAAGEVLYVGDIEGQTRQILENMKLILQEAGATLDDVVRIVTYMLDIRDHPKMHAIRRSYFGDAPPASTTVEVTRLYHPDQLIEIEATAIIEV